MTAVAAAALLLGVVGATAQGGGLYPVADCSKLTTQLELNRCASKNFKSADAMLNDVYQQAMAQLDDAATRQRLIDAERAWVRYRDEECAYEVGPEQGGGSIWPMEMGNCLEEHTAARIRVFMKLRGCTAGVSACNPH